MANPFIQSRRDIASTATLTGVRAATSGLNQNASTAAHMHHQGAVHKLGMHMQPDCNCLCSLSGLSCDGYTAAHMQHHVAAKISGMFI